MKLLSFKFRGNSSNFIIHNPPVNALVILNENEMDINISISTPLPSLSFQKSN